MSDFKIKIKSACGINHEWESDEIDLIDDLGLDEETAVAICINSDYPDDLWQEWEQQAMGAMGFEVWVENQ